MLFLQLKSGEYLTIGEEIAVQVFQDTGSRIRVAVKAPKEMAILRGEVRERNGEDRPEGLIDRDRGDGTGPGGSAPERLSREEEERRSGQRGACGQRFQTADESVEI